MLEIREKRVELFGFFLSFGVVLKFYFFLLFFGFFFLVSTEALFLYVALAAFMAWLEDIVDLFFA